MNLLVNLIPIKKGGGQQVATNFVTNLIGNNTFNVFYLVTEGTFIQNKLNEMKVKNVITVKKSILHRIFFQFFQLRNIILKFNIDVIYTMFGPGLKVGKTVSVTGCAYSNLFFPEIDFWHDYSYLDRVKLKLIDQYRLRSTLKSDAIVFENEAMQKRAASIYGYPEENTAFILPSISSYDIENVDPSFNDRLDQINSKAFNILILSGWHKNKNIEMVPFILNELSKLGRDDVNFVITVSKAHQNSVSLLEEAKRLKVDHRILFFESVKPNEVFHLFQRVQATILLSLLESFSNNIIESWYFKKPLFISDEEWSRAICKDAAIFVSRSDARDIAGKINQYLQDQKVLQTLTMASESILKTYPSPEEKVKLQLKFLKKIYNQIKH